MDGLSVMIQEDSKCQVDLINFTTVEVENTQPKQTPEGMNKFVEQLTVNSSDDPFEFHLQKAKMNSRIGKHRSFRQKSLINWNKKITDSPDLKNKNSLFVENKKQRPRFSYWDSSLLEKDASFDLLNNTIEFENSVMTNSPLLKRRSMSVGNLSFSLHEKDPVIPFESIKTEAKKIAELIEKSQLFNCKQEESVEDKMLTEEVSTSLHISTSSEDEIGLPEVVILSTKKNSRLDISNKAEFIKYKQFISSHISSSEIDTAESKTIIDKADENSFLGGVKNSINEDKITETCASEENGKLLKLDNNKLKLLQRDIEEVKSKPFKPIKKKENKGPEKRGPLKVFAPHNSQILKNIVAPKQQMKKVKTENVSFSIPVATSTPEQKKGCFLKKPTKNHALNVNNSLKMVKTSAELDHSSSHPRASTKPNNIVKNIPKMPTVISTKIKHLSK